MNTIPDLPEAGEFWPDGRKRLTLTEGDAAADLAGTPRPDNPTVGMQITVSTGDSLSTHLPDSEGGEL